MIKRILIKTSFEGLSSSHAKSRGGKKRDTRGEVAFIHECVIEPEALHVLDVQISKKLESIQPTHTADT